MFDPGASFVWSAWISSETFFFLYLESLFLFLCTMNIFFFCIQIWVGAFMSDRPQAFDPGFSEVLILFFVFLDFHFVHLFMYYFVVSTVTIITQ